MGRMQFIVPNRNRLPSGAIELAYLANVEESPNRTRASWQGDRLALDRDEAESATLTIPWLAGDRPALALSTGTLVERLRPYVLPVELARGTVYRLRTYAFAWRSLGLILPDGFEGLLHQVLEKLARAATSQDRPAAAAEFAEQALDMALVASSTLCAAYGEQSIPARRGAASRAPFLVGVTLDEQPLDQPFAEQVLAACNSVAVPFTWRSIEPTENARSWEESDAQIAWCQARQVRICGGPLLRLDTGALPVWLDPGAGFDGVLAKVERHLLAVVERYAGRVQLWNCSAGLNTGEALPVSEEQRLRLAVRAIEIVRAADPNTPIIITLDQPWGDYLRDQRRQLSPIHLADVLVRGDLGLSGFGLRLNIGLGHGVTLPRDVLEISRQMDRWSVFNLPLLIEFTLPPSASPGELREQAWIDQMIPVLLGKPAVQAVFWGQLADGVNHQFSDRGLFDREGRTKSAFQAFSAIRGLVD
jgi:hypothetical protein